MCQYLKFGWVKCAHNMYYVKLYHVSVVSVSLRCPSSAPPLAPPPSTAVHLPSLLRSSLQKQQLHNRWSYSLPSLKETC